MFSSRALLLTGLLITACGGAKPVEPAADHPANSKAQVGPPIEPSDTLAGRDPLMPAETPSSQPSAAPSSQPSSLPPSQPASAPAAPKAKPAAPKPAEDPHQGHDMHGGETP